MAVAIHMPDARPMLPVGWQVRRGLQVSRAVFSLVPGWRRPDRWDVVTCRWSPAKSHRLPGSMTPPRAGWLPGLDGPGPPLAGLDSGARTVRCAWGAPV